MLSGSVDGTAGCSLVRAVGSLICEEQPWTSNRRQRGEGVEATAEDIYCPAGAGPLVHSRQEHARVLKGVITVCAGWEQVPLFRAADRAHGGAGGPQRGAGGQRVPAGAASRALQQAGRAGNLQRVQGGARGPPWLRRTELHPVLTHRLAPQQPRCSKATSVYRECEKMDVESLTSACLHA